MVLLLVPTTADRVWAGNSAKTKQLLAIWVTPCHKPLLPWVLPSPPNSAPSGLLTDPGSSRAGKEGEKLMYLGDIQEQDHPELNAS